MPCWKPLVSDRFPDNLDPAIDPPLLWLSLFNGVVVGWDMAVFSMFRLELISLWRPAFDIVFSVDGTISTAGLSNAVIWDFLFCSSGVFESCVDPEDKLDPGVSVVLN